jgi:hypothetical protein
MGASKNCWTDCQPSGIYCGGLTSFFVLQCSFRVSCKCPAHNYKLTQLTQTLSSNLTVHLLLLFLFCPVTVFLTEFSFFNFCPVRQLAASHHRGELLNFNRHRERTRSLPFVLPRASYMLLLCDWLTPSRNFSSDQYAAGNSFPLCVFFPVTQTSTRRDIIYSNLGLFKGFLLNPECRPDCADSLHPLCVLRSVAISIGQGLFLCCCCFCPRGVCEHRYSLVHILYCPANANRISETTTIGVEMGGKTRCNVQGE